MADAELANEAELRVAIAGIGATLLGEVETFLRRYVSYPSDHCRVAHALWIAHTHCMAAWESTPRLAFLSPEPASGKTRALEITESLVPDPIMAINATSSYLLRKIGGSAALPTLLYDEIDTVFGPKAKGNEEIRAVLNAGHRRGAVAGRCVMKGREIQTEELPAFCAVALAGLGDLPDTIISRSIVIPMKRRTADEIVVPFRVRRDRPIGNEIRDRLSIWVPEAVGAGSTPRMPPGVTDRAADAWEPLIAVADAAGCDWPERARASAVSLVSQSRENALTLGSRLLGDLRSIFRGEVMFTRDILSALCAIEEAPWSDLRGTPLDARRLAALLRNYGVTSKQVRIGDQSSKGYSASDLRDPWNRYLDAPRQFHIRTETTETSETIHGFPR